MPRTTLDLDPSVLSQLRDRGARERKSMGQIASELLIQALVEPEKPGPSPLRWLSRDLGTPKVALEDKDALRALLDSKPVRDSTPHVDRDL